VVFDTMVIAYALLGFTEFHNDSIAALRAAEEIWAPELLRAELLNVLWQWSRARQLAPEAAHTLITESEHLVQLVPTDELREPALDLAITRDHPAYDTLFVALAAVRGWKVITYDQKMLQKFPEWAISVPEFLSGVATPRPQWPPARPRR